MLKRGRFVPMRNGDEYDALTKWKSVFEWRSGTRKWIKRGFNKRERQRAREIIDDWEEWEME